MKLTSLLARASGLAAGAFLLGVAFDSHPLSLFSVATATFVLLTLSGDYATRPMTAEPSRQPVPARKAARRCSLPLAV
jgi:hypothetical protein